MNIKLIPNQWTKKIIPLTVIKHRLLQTDPLYKFVINSVINARSNIAVRRDSEDNDYYDMLNMSILQDTLLSAKHWLDYINNNYNLSLEIVSTGSEQFQSSNFLELIFATENERDTFDTVYNILKNNENFNSEGLNILIDFSLKVSGGFIRNKLALDTDLIKNWILNDLNFSTLQIMMVKEEGSENFKIKNSYKQLYNLNRIDIEYVETLFQKNNTLFPLDSNNNNIFWSYLDSYLQTNSIIQKEALFNFKFDGVVISEVNTRSLSFALNQYNRPMSISTNQGKFDHQNQKVYITMGGPANPVSTDITRGFLTTQEPVVRLKNIQTKINNHIYMVNKK